MSEIYGKQVCINNMSTKMTIIETMFAACNKSEYKTNDYVKNLRSVFKVAFNIADVKSLLKKISQWTRYRDEHIHGMFNKDLDELRAGYRSHVEQGYKLARELDKYVGRIKDA